MLHVFWVRLSKRKLSGDSWVVDGSETRNHSTPVYATACAGEYLLSLVPQSSCFARLEVVGLYGILRPIRARMEWAGAPLRFVVVRERILLPFAVAVVSIESYVGMYRHSVIGQHALVNALPDGRCDRLRGGRIDEKRPGLKDEHHSWTEISAPAALIGG
jgi:hypothetical protein